MSAHTIQKIHILSSSYHATLSKFMDLENLPENLQPRHMRENPSPVRRKKRLGAAVGDINTPPPSSSPSMDRWDDDENAYPSRPLPLV